MENKIYLVINGDNTSEELSDNIVNDNVEGFVQSSGKFDNARKGIDQIVQQAGGKVIVSASDEAVYELPSSDYSELAQKIMEAYENASGNTVTVGIGSSLSQAYEALIGGKNSGKGKYVNYDEMNNEDNEQFQDDQEPSFEEDSENQEQEDADYAPEQSNMYSESEENPDFVDDFLPEEEEESEQPHDMDNDYDEDSSNDFVEDEDEVEHNDIHSLLSHHLNDNEDQDESEDEIPFLQSHEYESGQDESLDEQSDIPQEEEEANLQQEDQGDFNEGDLQGEISSESQATEEPDTQEASKEEIKQKIVQSLKQFKDNKGAIEEARINDPEAYQSMINMLRAMIEMAKQLNLDVSEEESEIPTDNVDGSDEQPEMMDSQIPNTPGIQSPKM